MFKEPIHPDQKQQKKQEVDGSELESNLDKLTEQIKEVKHELAKSNISEKRKFDLVDALSKLYKRAKAECVDEEKKRELINIYMDVIDPLLWQSKIFNLLHELKNLQVMASILVRNISNSNSAQKDAQAVAKALDKMTEIKKKLLEYEYYENKAEIEETPDGGMAHFREKIESYLKK